MFQVVYEYAEPWPQEGALKVGAPPISGEIKVSPESARRRANSYLSMDVAMEFQPGEPVLLWGEEPVWRIPVHLHLPSLGQVTTLGFIEVDAMTRAVIILSEEQINKMRARAHAIATRLTPAAAPAV